MTVALGTAALGLAMAAVGLLLDPGAFAHAWLAALALACAWPVGATLLLLSHALTGGRWGRAARPGLLAGVSVLAVLPVLAVPFLFTLPALYPWARPDGAALPNHAWLNLPFASARFALYLACWLGAGALAWRGVARPVVASAGIAALALTGTFGSIDLILSLDPRFTSSIFGMLWLAGAGSLALALAVLLSPDGGRDASNDLGELLLGLAVLWAYLDFMQLLIVWQSDLVRQVPWYRVRTSGVAGVVAVLVALAHTVVPFFALLPRAARRSARALRAVAALVAGSEALRTWWLVLPARGRGFTLLDAGCMLLVGGVLFAVALRARGSRVPAHA